MPKFHVLLIAYKKMAEEFQRYIDILKREREEFRRQLIREVGTS